MGGWRFPHVQVDYCCLVFIVRLSVYRVRLFKSRRLLSMPNRAYDSKSCQNGEVVYVAATSQTTWIYGSASWYMAEEDRQAHLGHVYADVVESDPKMFLTVECK